MLVRNNIRFTEGPGLLTIPFAITFLSAVLGLLNLAGKRVAWTVSLVYEPILLIVGGLIGGQVFAAQLLEHAFKTSGDVTLARLNAKAIVTAVTKAWPPWFYPYTAYARFGLATFGSLLVIILLLTPSAKAYLQKGRNLRIRTLTHHLEALHAQPTNGVTWPIRESIREFMRNETLRAPE